MDFRLNIVNTGKNGELSNLGDVRSNPQQVKDIFTKLSSTYIDQNNHLHIGFFAHGGLVDQNEALKSAENWANAFNNSNILPVSLIWETGIFEIIETLIENCNENASESFDLASLLIPNVINIELIERYAQNLKNMWDEMKNRANKFGTGQTKLTGGQVILNAIQELIQTHPQLKIKLHFVGHSAGAILLTDFIHTISSTINSTWKNQVNISSVNFLAPAVRLDKFDQKLMPLILNNSIKYYRQWHLRNDVERTDPCYVYTGGSLLYLVARGFETGIAQANDPDRIRAKILGIKELVLDFLTQKIAQHSLNQKFFIETLYETSQSTNDSMHGIIGTNPYVQKMIIHSINDRRKLGIDS